MNKSWLIPPQSNAEFVSHMEDVLDVYQCPLEPNYPVVCFDESNKQLSIEKQVPLPLEADKPIRYDSEYERNGVSNLFMFVAPFIGWRHVEVTERRTAIDYAHQMKYLVDEAFPDAIKIVLVQDNLNTHTPASLYKAFPAAEAKRILDKLEFHYTPKHGSWLNMAEIELSVLNGQCLDRRIPDPETLKQEVAAWEHKRNEQVRTINWRFTAEDARIKLTRLYPSFTS